LAHAVIVAGGSGLRMGSDRRKQYLFLAGRPILCHTLHAFLKTPAIADIRLVAPLSDADYCRDRILSQLPPHKPIRLVPGGRSRQASVRNGLRDLDASAEPGAVVAIHDGVRPLVRSGDIGRCIEGARSGGGCILGVPAVDTLKRVDGGGVIRGTLSREAVWYAQTPQAFRFGAILDAHEAALAEGIEETDDAALVERMGGEVKVIRGRRSNLKITTPEDLLLAEAFFRLEAAGEGDDPGEPG
jgi:2-C-methyl-D-erythritol 4-phosphate cytidylyltransferase